MVSLFHVYADLSGLWGAPNLSSFCMKVETYMSMDVLFCECLRPNGENRPWARCRTFRTTERLWRAQVLLSII